MLRFGYKRHKMYVSSAKIWKNNKFCNIFHQQCETFFFKKKKFQAKKLYRNI